MGFTNLRVNCLTLHHAALRFFKSDAAILLKFDLAKSILFKDELFSLRSVRSGPIRLQLRRDLSFSS